jgi:hypothetical protein
MEVTEYVRKETQKSIDTIEYINLNNNFNDEIISIEEIGYEDTIDIEVSDDHLFYANGILTKNSMGLPMTADAMVAIIMPEQLRSQGLQIWKILKNRFGDVVFKKFGVRVDFSTCRYYDANIGIDVSTMNETVPSSKSSRKTPLDMG